MRIVPNIGPHLHHPFDLLPGGWLLVEGPDEPRAALVEAFRESAYHQDPFWRVPPVFTGQPDAGSEETHHERVVRAQRSQGGFVVSDGSWMGRLAATAPRDPAALESSLTARKAEVWGTDTPSLAIFLLDGTEKGARFWFRAAQHTPNHLLMASRMGPSDRVLEVYRQMRWLRLTGRLVSDA